MDKNKIYSIEEIKHILTDTFKKYGVEKVYIFGSYATKKATKSSDIDIIIKKGNIRTLFQMVEFEQEIAKLLNKEVDIITEESYTLDDGINFNNDIINKINKVFFDRILKERVLIYG